MYSKGVCWVADCRIPYLNENDMTLPEYANKVQDKPKHTSGAMSGGINKIQVCNIQGRFTPNLLVCDDMLNDGSIGGSAYCPPTEYQYEPNDSKFNSGARRTKTGIGDKGTNSRYYDLDLWFDKMLEGL